jgi:hypothetical protein
VNSNSIKIINTGVWVIMILFFSSCHPSIKFDATRWKYEDTFGIDKRHLMTTDLIQNFQLPGKKYSELISLLGKPNHTEKGYCWYVTQESKDAFHVEEPIWLKRITFLLNENNIVTSVAVETNDTDPLQK